MKVGKAIYNILSQSTEVQSNFPFNTTDYSPTGTELATFSLGNISFANLDGSISTSLGGIAYRSVAIDDTNDSRPRVLFDNLTEGKSYKVVYTPSSTTGASDFDLFQNGVRLVHNHNITSPLTTYIIAGAGYNGIDFNGTNTFTTDYSLSVKEMAVNKIFPELAPPDIDAPYIVYSVVSNSPSDTKNANGDIDTASIEVYGFQDTYNKAVDLGVSIRAALDRKTGTYNTIEIQSTNYVNEQMDVNEARKLWAAIQDYSIRIKNI